jgi:hypothetical protein
MAVLTECPACHHRWPVEEPELGTEVACRQCGDRFQAADIGRPPGVKKHRAGLIFTLGTLALAVFGIFGPFAWLLGWADLRKMERGEMDPSGMKNTRIGVTMGKIGTVKFVFEVLFITAVVAAILAYALYAAEQGLPVPFSTR